MRLSSDRAAGGKASRSGAAPGLGRGGALLSGVSLRKAGGRSICDGTTARRSALRGAGRASSAGVREGRVAGSAGFGSASTLGGSAICSGTVGARGVGVALAGRGSMPAARGAVTPGADGVSAVSLRSAGGSSSCAGAGRKAVGVGGGSSAAGRSCAAAVRGRGAASRGRDSTAAGGASKGRVAGAASGATGTCPGVPAESVSVREGSVGTAWARQRPICCAPGPASAGAGCSRNRPPWRDVRPLPSGPSSRQTGVVSLPLPDSPCRVTVSWPQPPRPGLSGPGALPSISAAHRCSRTASSRLRCSTPASSCERVKPGARGSGSRWFKGGPGRRSAIVASALR